MITLQEYKNICKNKTIRGFRHYFDGKYSLIDLGNDDELLMEVIYDLGRIADKEIGKDCYILLEHLPFIDLIYNLKKKESFILAIDGMCGSGKSTLAHLLKQIFDVHVFHMDDFYLPMEKRTTKRLSIPGNNVDHERFLETVLKPLSLKQTVNYQPYDCSLMELSKITQIAYKDKNIIEGSYALKDELVNYYTNKVVLRISSDLQIERLTKRNPLKVDQFITRWIPLENQYFEYCHIFDKHHVINID